MNSQAKHRRDLHGPPPSAKERRELADLFDDQGTAVRELLSGDEDARGRAMARLLDGQVPR